MDDEVFLVYRGGEGFVSRLAACREQALDAVIDLAFGEMPDPIDNPDEFEEMVSLKDDFLNPHLWRELGNLWETDLENGYIVAVRIQSHLN